MKNYTIRKERDGKKPMLKTGTLAELNHYYGKNAKSIKTLVNQLQKAADEREAACFNRTYYYLETGEKPEPIPHKVTNLFDSIDAAFGVNREPEPMHRCYCDELTK